MARSMDHIVKHQIGQMVMTIMQQTAEIEVLKEKIGKLQDEVDATKQIEKVGI